MNPATEPLTYLALGFLAFLCLLLGLRLIATELELRSKPLLDSPQWTGKLPLQLVQIFEESHDVRSFVFRRVCGSLIPAFKPGQFLSFQIGMDPKILRSYSISSSPSDHASIQVSVKRLPGGLGSNWMHSLKVDDVVLAYPPAGYFVESTASRLHKVFIAGGIGITPFISMLLSKNTSRDNGAVSLFYGMRSRNDMAFHNLLCHLASRSLNFRYYPYLSEADQAWEGRVGNISADSILDTISAKENFEFYLCGPSVMMDKLIPDFLRQGVSEDRIHLEKFVSPTAVDRDSIPSRNLNLSWNGQKIPYEGRQTILESLEKSAIDHPFACRVGVCGSCKCKVTGKFIQLTDAGLTEDEKKSGYCLPCVAFPVEDLDISLS